MSHVATIEIEINDLGALQDAAKQLGLELVKGQKTYKWFGRSVGDYPLPEGFTAADLGHCEHALRIPGNSAAYEIGVVKRRDGRPGYTLLWDFWRGGFGLTDKVGAEGKRLVQEYGVAVTMKGSSIRDLIREGYKIERTNKEDGSVVLTASR